jgi:cytochrome c peroxidase
MLRRAALSVAVAAFAGIIVALAVGRPVAALDSDAGLLISSDPFGQLRTLDVNGQIDLDNPFFQDLGTNGRRCVTCHQPAFGWTITPANVQARFAATKGTDPIFTNNDGSNCEGALPASRADKRAAYSLLLTRGLIRVGLDVPRGAEFAIDGVVDPNHCGPATNDASFYRRPLPSTNVSFLSAVMWDGRESSPSTTTRQDLMKQANDATRGHAQAAMDITSAQARQIVDFELGLFTAQARDTNAGSLTARGASGGPFALSTQTFFIGINDPVGLNPAGTPFDPRAFNIFAPWIAHAGALGDPIADARRAIARGEELFNTKPMTISGVAGLNGESFGGAPPLPDSFSGTCTICHDAPNVGNHSVKAPLNIGLTDPAVAPYLPVYAVRNLATQEVVETTDLGRAMITGKWQDIGKFKGPILRALASRAPYFHNGSAATLEEVVDFYDRRFNIGLTAAEKADLVAFLRAL